MCLKLPVNGYRATRRGGQLHRCGHRGDKAIANTRTEAESTQRDIDGQLKVSV